MKSVYVITHVGSGRVYVGQSANPHKRFKQHIGTRASYIGRALRLYGKLAFRLDVVADALTDEEACASEQLLIALLGSRDPKRGFNLTNGGEGAPGLRHTQETREKMRRSHTGLKHSAYTRARIGEGHKGCKWTPEWRTKVVAALRGKKMHAATKAALLASNVGRPLSEAHKEALRRAAAGRVCSDETRAKMVAGHWTKRPDAADIIERSASNRRGISPSEETRAKLRLVPRKSRPHSEATREKMRAARQRPKDPERDESIRRMRDGGMGIVAIAKATGCSCRTVHKVLGS